MLALLLRLHLELTRPRDDRGDVPGWVMVVVLSAGLAAGLYEIAGPALKDMLTSALDQVRGN
jgi:hypothetical protein